MQLRIPLHISGFWAPVLTSNPFTTGSLGAGLTLQPYVSARINNSSNNTSCDIYLNGRCINGLSIIKTINELLGNQKKGVVYVESPVDLGDGYGLSAAIAIAYSFKKLIELGVRPTINKVGIIAHYAEVTNMTGLADVIAEIRGGGLVVRIRPGPPGIGEVDIVPIKEDIGIITLKLKKSLTTPKMLKDMMELFKTFGLKAYSSFIKDPSLDKFIEYSYVFSRSVGFLNREFDEVIKIRLGRYVRLGYVLGYFVKKSLLVIVTEHSCVREVSNLISDLGVRVRLLTPMLNGLVVVSSDGQDTEISPKVRIIND